MAKKADKTAKKAKKDKAKKVKKVSKEEFTYNTPEGDQSFPVPETPSSDRGIIIDKSPAFGGKTDTEESPGS
jgi:hypothetical protein